MDEALFFFFLLLLLGSPQCKAFMSSADMEPRHLHPCNFDPRCLCSSGAEYGSVICDGVPLADVPMELQESRVFKLTLRDNQMIRFPDAKLSGSGMWGLEVSHNPVRAVPSMAFYGLERALWELHLHHNLLTEVPAESIGLLKKLSVLNLADNQISDLRRSDLRSLSSSLRSLDLSGNSLTSVPEGIFWDLKRLERLDLSRNNIIQMHSMAFQNGVPLLNELRLSDNLMGSVPYIALGHVKSLRALDLSNNRIQKIEDPYFNKDKLRLDWLDLSENDISRLDSGAFQNFAAINATSLRGNPLGTIEPGAFGGLKSSSSGLGVRRLDLSGCHLELLEPGSFRGLEKSLESLDLAGNRLADLPEELFADFDLVRDLRLNDNMLALSPNLTFNGFRYTIKDLNLQGEDMHYVPLEEIGIMRNLRTLGLSAVKNYGSVSKGQFSEFAPSLEELNLVDSDVRSLDRGAFAHVPSVSALDLSNNRIDRVDDDAFLEVGASLRRLRAANALYFRQLPSAAFRALTAVRTVDLSNNHISRVPLDTFHKMAQLRHLYLQDNEISTFKRGTFHSQANPLLSVLDLGFNEIPSVSYDTFRFPELTRLILNDNRIAKLETRSFVEMTKLVELNLEGNKIRELPDETFQNLHRLEKLNLAFNSLESLNLAAFDSVGTLAHLHLDLSHNNMQALRVNRSSSFNGPTPSNIMHLDLSYNNISVVEVPFFEPIANELKILNLSRNALTDVGPDNVGHLRRLHCVDLSYNSIAAVEPTTFMASRRLRAVHLNHNNLTSVSRNIFNSQGRLRYVDLSHNNLETLPELVFQRTSLEIFKASHNRLSEIPVKALNPVQSTLRHLELAGNLITTISDSQLNQIQLLVKLDLSDNRVSTIDQEAFCCVPNLEHLGLAGNPLHRIDPSSLMGVKPHLRYLNLANTNLTQLPGLQLPMLKSLDVSSNQLTFVPPNTLVNLSEVRELDLSRNHLPTPPSSAWHSMHRLRRLSLSGNPMDKLTNDSFVGLKHLEELDISDIEAESFQSGSFGTMPNLISLEMRLSEDNAEEDISFLLRNNPALRRIHFHLAPSLAKKSASSGFKVLRHTLQREELPQRLNQVVIEGEEVANIHPAAFKQLRSRRVSLSFLGRKKLSVDRDVFLNLGRAQNLTVKILPPSAVNVFNSSNHLSGDERRLGNPVTTYSPGHPRAVFLTGLSIGGNSWDCDCDGIGWVEKWLRRWRGTFCSHSTSESSISSSTTSASSALVCQSTLRDMRASSCRGKRTSSVLQELKVNLECEAFSEAPKLLGSIGTSWTLLLLCASMQMVFRHI